MRNAEAVALAPACFTDGYKGRVMIAEVEPMSLYEVSMHICGWIAMVLILLSYILVTTGKITAKHACYQWMNLIGAAFFVAHLSWKQAWPAMSLNIIWCFISVAALYFIYKKRSKASAEKNKG